MQDKIVVTGMRPTGKLHLGHYLGVIENMLKLQDEYRCFYFIADWHALTTKYDKTESLRQDVIDVAIDWLASGINPEKSTIYVQNPEQPHRNPQYRSQRASPCNNREVSTLPRSY